MYVLKWKDEGHRQVAVCGEVAVGAVFPGLRRVRWRAWVTKNANPVDQTASSIESAKLEVEKRFDEFLRLAWLTPRA